MSDGFAASKGEMQRRGEEKREEEKEEEEEVSAALKIEPVAW